LIDNLKAFINANNFIFISFKKYRKFSTRSEKIFDILGSIALAFGLTLISYIFFNTSITDFIRNYQNINTIIITAISILAGFNVASISVIATSQSDLIKELKNKPSETDPEMNKFSIIIIFFTWAIIIQLLVVLLGIIFYFLCNFYVNESYTELETPIWIWLLFTFWLSCVFHSIAISIRNVKMLFLLIVKS